MNFTQAAKEKIRKEAVDWLILLQSEQCTDQDRQAFAIWQAQSPSHAQLYGHVSGQWQVLGLLKDKDFPARTATIRHQNQARTQPRPQLFAYATAACLILALALTAFTQNGWWGVQQSFSVPKGSRETILLADGSTLELNSGSKVTTHFNYWQRKVELTQGEAFFTVAYDENRPFEVQAGQGQITDIGTAFEVYRHQAKVLVAVQEGIVEVKAKDTRRLTAGQSLAYDAIGAIQDESQDIANLTAWRKGQIVFQSRRLDEVLAEISRYHDVHIAMQQPSLAKLKVSGTFYTANLNELLDAITVIVPVKVDYQDQRNIVLKVAR